MCDTPLFILASPRSFTSLICGMFGQHPDAYGFPELNLFVEERVRELLNHFEGKAQFQFHGLLRTLAQLYAGEQTRNSIGMAYRWLMVRSEYSTTDIYYELCQKIYPLKGVDKSPAYTNNSVCLKRIITAFPNAYFLHLVRHPFAQCLSSIKGGGEGYFAKALGYYDYTVSPPIVDPQFAWLDVQRQIIEFSSTIPTRQTLCLRGEDLLSDPRTYLQKICTWLGLTWNDFAFEAMMHPENSPYACLGPYGATLGNDANFLRSPTYQQRDIQLNSLDEPLPWSPDGSGFAPEVIQLAHELGYD